MLKDDDVDLDLALGVKSESSFDFYCNQKVRNKATAMQAPTNTSLSPLDLIRRLW